MDLIIIVAIAITILFFYLNMAFLYASSSLKINPEKFPKVITIVVKWFVILEFFLTAVIILYFYFF